MVETDRSKQRLHIQLTAMDWLKMGLRNLRPLSLLYANTPEALEGRRPPITSLTTDTRRLLFSSRRNMNEIEDVPLQDAAR